MPMPAANRGIEPVRSVRAALMLRVSTPEQARGYGLDVQERTGCEYINRQPGWRLSPELIFRDEGVSGSVVARPGMLRLERAAREGLVDVIVVHKFDRIGRTARAFWTWIWAMEDLGIPFVSATEDIDTSKPSGQQRLRFYATMAESESGLICERMQGGRQRKALNAGWVGGPPPWGYAISDTDACESALVVNEEEARVVLKAVSLLVDEGMNVAQVARTLNKLGYPTRSGRPWSASNLHRRLRSPALVKGEVVFRKPDGEGNNRTKLDQDACGLQGLPLEWSDPRKMRSPLRRCLPQCRRHPVLPVRWQQQRQRGADAVHRSVPYGRRCRSGGLERGRETPR